MYKVEINITTEWSDIFEYEMFEHFDSAWDLYNQKVIDAVYANKAVIRLYEMNSENAQTLLKECSMTSL